MVIDMMNILQSKRFLRVGLLGAACAVTLLAGCGQPQSTHTDAQPVATSPAGLRLYAAPPQIPGQAELNLNSQAMGAYAALRNQAQQQGFALKQCNQLVIFVRQDALGRNGWNPVEQATSHYFGTPLNPNTPPVQMIAVQGFANPGQLLLVEADFSR